MTTLLITMKPLPGASFIAGVRYSRVTKTMLVSIDGRVYAYEGVSRYAFDRMRAAAIIAAAEKAQGVKKPSTSAGAVYNRLVKPRPCLRLI